MQQLLARSAGRSAAAANSASEPPALSLRSWRRSSKASLTSCDEARGARVSLWRGAGWISDSPGPTMPKRDAFLQGSPAT